MIRGLSFRISQKIDVPLFNIFTGINIEDYYWFCVPDQEEVWNEKGCMPFFEKTTYTGKEFSDLVKQECLNYKHTLQKPITTTFVLTMNLRKAVVNFYY